MEILVDVNVFFLFYSLKQWKHSYVSLVVMKKEGFVIMYKVIILTVQGQCTNCIRPMY